jgi:polyphosphate:AMP phosphotransferase
MFEAVELGQKISKEEFDAGVAEIRERLIVAQTAFKNYNGPLIIILNGMDGSGKGELVNYIGSLIDLRNVHIETFWQETDNERKRPLYWRYWMNLPKRGRIAFFFGAWYSDEILKAVKGKISDSDFEKSMTKALNFESDLANDNAIFIKLWYHLSKKETEKNAKDTKKTHGKGEKTDRAKWHCEHYDEIIKVASKAIRLTDHSQAQWHLVEADDKRHRTLKTIRIITETLEAAVKSIGVEVEKPQITINTAPPILSKVDLTLSIDHSEYKKQLPALQESLNKSMWKAYKNERSVIALFEGWDAAGKGSAIRRVVQGTDIRLVKVMSVSAPTDEEKAHHYLWRFWRKVPSAGFMTIYDRSWYGRVLVERVEEFADDNDWQRAYEEINRFEEELTSGGITLLKFWVHIDKDEQMKRFKERESLPWKQYKITSEDWRNREKWDMYEDAANEMITRTSTNYAPWHIIAGNDKKHARVKILETICKALEEKE